MIDLAQELIQAKEEGAGAVLATVVNARENSGLEAGEKCLIRDGRIKAGTVRHEGLREAILREASARLEEERPKLVSLGIPGVEGGVEVFF